MHPIVGKLLLYANVDLTIVKPISTCVEIDLTIVNSLVTITHYFYSYTYM